MSDTMLFGVLKMPYEMAMRDEISRIQFYQRVQELVARVEAQPEQQAEPVISAWSLREVYFDEDGEPSMHRSPPAAQRPWQGLTDKEVQFYIEKHSKLVNAGYDKPTDTNFFAKTFDSTGFYKEVSTILKERNT